MLLLFDSFVVSYYCFAEMFFDSGEQGGVGQGERRGEQDRLLLRRHRGPGQVGWVRSQEQVLSPNLGVLPGSG